MFFFKIPSVSNNLTGVKEATTFVGLKKAPKHIALRVFLELFCIWFSKVRLNSKMKFVASDEIRKCSNFETIIFMYTHIYGKFIEIYGNLLQIYGKFIAIYGNLIAIYDQFQPQKKTILPISTFYKQIPTNLYQFSIIF